MAEGYSSLDNEEAVIRREPFASIWLPVREDRTPNVRLVANPSYWDKKRGPHLEEILFRNDLSPEQALELICTTEGEVDILTEVPPAQAGQVESSAHAKLVSIDAIRSVAGIINRNAEGLPLHDKRARLALNMAIDRDRLVNEAMFGKADPLGGLTPPAAANFLHRLTPYPHQPQRANDLWQEVGGSDTRPLRLATTVQFEAAAQSIKDDIEKALGIEVQVTAIIDPEELLRGQHKLAEKTEPLDWDIFIQLQGAQAAETAALEIHRAFVGETGEFRAGPALPAFESLFNELVGETSTMKMAQMTHRIDKFVFDEALALFLFAPHALYAVNNHVKFTPYRTTFELAQTKVTEEHWSRQVSANVVR